MVSLIDKSVSMIAQTAFPASVRIGAGSNRRFFLTRIGAGTASISANPTLGGEAHDTLDNRGGQGLAITTWTWDEADLATIGIPVAGGSAAVAAFAETGVTEYMWAWGTIKDHDQSSGIQPIGRSIGAADELDIPVSTTPLTYPSVNGPALQLQVLAIKDASASLDKARYQNVNVKGPVAQTSYVGYLLYGISDELTQYVHPVSGMTGALGQIQSFEPVTFQSLADKGKGLPIKRVKRRSIDAKTISDRYNLGVPTQPDYDFPGGRKFYQ